MSIDVANESGVEVDEAALATLARHVLAAMRVHPRAELSVLLVAAEAMAELHQQWMEEQGPTDVLAFPMDELRPGGPAAEEVAEPGQLGDVVLCPQVATEQAAAAGHTPAEELSMLATHGLLHLLGYDHEEPAEERQMFGLQAQLLDSWWGEREPGRPEGGSNDPH